MLEHARYHSGGGCEPQGSEVWRGLCGFADQAGGAKAALAQAESTHAFPADIARISPTKPRVARTCSALEFSEWVCVIEDTQPVTCIIPSMSNCDVAPSSSSLVLLLLLLRAAFGLSVNAVGYAIWFWAHALQSVEQPPNASRFRHVIQCARLSALQTGVAARSRMSDASLAEAECGRERSSSPQG